VTGDGAAPGDPFAGQVSDADVLARLYDLEHDPVTEDFAFYRGLAARVRGAVLDLGCGSGRLFGAFLDGRASRVVGVDGSAAMLRRARLRIDGDERLRAAAAEGRLELVQGDVRSVRRRERFGLIVAAGVVPHLDGPEDLSRLLARAAHALTPRGLLVLDDIGPAGLPDEDLPWRWTGWSCRTDGRTPAAASSAGAWRRRGSAWSFPRSWTCRTPMVRSRVYRPVFGSGTPLLTPSRGWLRLRDSRLPARTGRTARRRFRRPASA
jgi:SAM-dependent methyltransferase